jgi:hypothetical protein
MASLGGDIVGCDGGMVRKGDHIIVAKVNDTEVA